MKTASRKINRRLEQLGLKALKGRPPLTGWLYVDATNQIGCSRCDVKAGDECRQPNSRRAPEPHGERCLDLRRAMGDGPFDKAYAHGQ